MENQEYKKRGYAYSHSPLSRNFSRLVVIQNIKNGLSDGISWNGKNIKYSSPEIHIYMPKDTYTQSLANSWKSTLEALHPEIRFEVRMLETFIK